MLRDYTGLRSAHFLGVWRIESEYILVVHTLLSFAVEEFNTDTE